MSPTPTVAFGLHRLWLRMVEKALGSNVLLLENHNFSILDIGKVYAYRPGRIRTDQHPVETRNKT